MKHIIYTLAFFAALLNCKAQSENRISTSDLTINNLEIIGSSKTFLTANFGDPNLIEDYYFEMDDVWTKKYIYDGIVFFLIEDIVESFNKIINSNYSVTNSSIKVGDSISKLETHYPLSYLHRETDAAVILLSNYSGFLTIYFDSNNIITEIGMFSY